MPIKLLLSLFTLLFASQFVSAQWIKQSVNTTASFRGLSVVNEKIVWASGTDGTVISTIDGGKTWNVIKVPGAEKLDFRDIEAFDANIAYILSIGNGESSRIYKTTDGGTTWIEQFRNKNEKAFFDAVACWDKNNCIAMSDPVDQKFFFVDTEDGGETWIPVDTSGMPEAEVGEAAFAASGTCLWLGPSGWIKVVSGGSRTRTFARRANREGAYFWLVTETPIVKGSPGKGIFSIAMWDLFSGIVVGGDYENPNEAKDNLAFTINGGATWQLGKGLSGYRSGVAYLDRDTIVAVGTNGTDITRDGGKTWKVFGKEDLNAVQSKGKRATWAVGPKGMVVKMK